MNQERVKLSNAAWIAIAIIIAIGVIAFCAQAQEKDKTPMISPDKKIEILTLQRDVNALQAELISMQAQFTEKQTAFQTKAKTLNEMAKALEVKGYTLNFQTLDYAKVAEKQAETIPPKQAEAIPKKE